MEHVARFPIVGIVILQPHSQALSVIWTPMEEILNFELVQADSRSYR
jgi:hypothetical protein